MTRLREIKRKRIIEAATVLFNQQGYSVNMDSIAKRADVSKQTIYSLFESKKILIELCIKNKVIQYQETTAVLSLDQPIERVLLDFAIHFQNNLLKPGAIQTYRNAIAQIDNHPEIAETYVKFGPNKSAALLERYLEEKIKDGSLELSIPIQDATVQLLLMFHGKAVYWRYLGAEGHETQEQRKNYLKNCIRTFLQSTVTNSKRTQFKT